jgi:hypothetical protein
MDSTRKQQYGVSDFVATPIGVPLAADIPKPEVNEDPLPSFFAGPPKKDESTQAVVGESRSE